MPIAIRPQHGTHGSQEIYVGHPDQDGFLAELPFQLVAIDTPPATLQGINHHFKQDDIVAAHRAGVVFPHPDRWRTHECGNTAKLLSEILTNLVK